MRSVFKYGLLLLVLQIMSVGLLKAQDIWAAKDLSAFKADLVTEEQLGTIRSKMSQLGLSESQAELLALQKGMPQAEWLKLRNRLAMVTSTGSSTSGNMKGNANNATQRSFDTTDISKPSEVQQKQPDINKTNELSIFGADIFTNSKMSFEPNLRIATPKNYILGPEDEIIIEVFGYQETALKAIISTEGTINLPYVGIVPLSGISIETASKRIKDRMIKNGYQSLGTGQSQLQVSLGKIRSIKVTIIGEANKPGTYTLPSLATVFNALYAAGGTNERGSLRNIQVIRNNLVVAKLDAYDFLLNGKQTQNIRLNDQDVIKIPVADIQVTIKGEVRKPAIFELLPNENLSFLLDIAGGFTPAAYKANIHVVQFTDKEKKVKDVPKEGFNSYFPQKGDEITVSKILNRFSNRISVQGAVYRPGEYELTEGLTLKQLIQKADGLQPDAFVKRGTIVRTYDDMTKELLSFHVANVLAGKDKDISLQKDDEVTIASEKDYKELFTLQIEGEVRKPGTYPFYEGMTLKDLVFQAGGFTDAASSNHIEVARRLKVDSINTDGLAQVLDVTTDKDLVVNGNKLALKPWDIISVRSNPGYKRQKMVYVAGEVNYPGGYVLVTSNEHVSEVLKRAGGLTKQAFLQGASLVRQNNLINKDTSETRLRKLQQQLKDSSGTLTEEYLRATTKVGLDLPKILQNPLGIEDVILQEGDVLNIPKEKREIKVNGEVMLPSEIVFKEGESLDYYINKAGGYTDNARKGKVYVLYPNGSGAKIKRFLGLKSYPVITPGCEILVPKTPERKERGLSTAEVIGLSSAFASLAGVVIAILRL